MKTKNLVISINFYILSNTPRIKTKIELSLMIVPIDQILQDLRTKCK